MCQYLLDYRRVLDACESLPRERSERFGYDLDSPTACFADRNIDIEHPFQALCPAHGGMLLYRRSLVAGYLASDALASFGWRYQGTVLAIRTVRRPGEHAVESGQVSPGLRNQSSKPSDEIQWLEDDVGSTIFMGCLQLIANVAA